MANAVTTGCLLSLMALYFLSDSVASSAMGASQGDSWTRRRRFSVLAHHQRLAGSDEGREADYDSLLRRKRDSAVNGGSDAKFNGEGGGNGAKWVDSTGELNNSEFLKENEDNTAQQQQQQQQQEQRSLMSNEEEVATAKRKWSDKNVRIWGKRKWSSKGLHLWGKRQEDALSEADTVEQPMSYHGGEENDDVRDWPRWEWQNNKVSDWEKDGAAETRKRQKWAKNNLKMWGKRHAETEEEMSADDMEAATEAVARMRAIGNADTEELSDGLQGTSRYGNRVSGYLRKRSNSMNNGVEQKWGKKGWANNNVRIWG